MKDFMMDAYNSDKGYAVKRNPTTGLNEMFVAGTHKPTTKKGVKEWVQNIGEGVEHLTLTDNKRFNVFTHHRQNFAHKLEDAAHSEKVDVVYGHSRGAAIISDFEAKDDFIFIGLDGATGITREHDNILNILHKGDLFDNAIAAHDKHSRNIHVPGKFHNVTAPSLRRHAKKKEKASKSKKKDKKEEVKSPPVIDRKRGRYSESSVSKKKKRYRGFSRGVYSPPRVKRTRNFFG
jgi:hypothetical protein